MFFQNRIEAGELLGQKLAVSKFENPMVFGLPRGGVVTAAEVARILKAPLDIIVVRKLGTPENPELGFGAVGPDDVKIIDREMTARLGITEAEIKNVIKKETEELNRRIKEYQREHKTPNLKNRTGIIVDDGIATGITVRAAIKYLRGLKPKQIIVATPVCAADTAEILRREADELICLGTPADFFAVGQFYAEFPQTTDEEVIQLLK